ncbi:MAG TPA: DMT family transporter [Dictyoglomaceae bacterium]|nr:DMT family transporter [Dictyoglomaceae bacterium]
MREEKNELKGVLILLLVTLIWGSTFSFSKIALSYLSPFLLLFLRFSLGTLSLLFYLLIKRQRIDINLPGFLLGMINFLAIALQTIGLKYTTATKTAFITGLSVLMVPFLEWCILKNKIYWNVWLGVFLGFLGLLLLTVDFSKLNTINLGDLLVFLCAILYTIQIVYIAYMVSKNSALDLAFSELLFTSIFSLIFYLILESRNFPINYFPEFIFHILYLGIIATSFALTLQLVGQKYLSPTKSALIYNLEPVFASIFAIFLLSEKLKITQWIGASFILIALFISMYDPSQDILKKEG